MKTYVAPGHSITVTAPSGGVTSGQGVLIGTLFGIAQADAAGRHALPARVGAGKACAGWLQNGNTLSQ